MNDSADLTQLDPAFEKVLRLRGVALAALVLAVALSAEAFSMLPTGLFALPALALAVWLALISPPRRYRRWGYAFGPDRLRVVSGYLFYHDAVVPLGRIQHIDVDQGPILRRWGLAQLTVHTAGSHGASIVLPGLSMAQAEIIREAIRQHIRQALG